METQNKRAFSAIAENSTKDDDADGDVVQPRSRRRIEAIFECGFCPQKFTVKSNLVYHELIHKLNRHEPKPIEKQFKCNVCCKNFVNKQQYDSHMETHEKPFHCSECGESFEEKVAVDRHRYTHLVDKVWRCDKCSKKYASEHHLRCHERIHDWIGSLDVCDFEANTFNMNEERYNCPYDGCAKWYNSKYALNGHIGATHSRYSRANAVKKPFVQRPYNESHNRKCNKTKSNLLERDSNQKTGNISKQMVFDQSCRFAEHKNEPNNLEESQVHDIYRDLFQCNHCDRKFNEVNKKLEHECRDHLPQIMLETLEDEKPNENSAEPKIIDSVIAEVKPIDNAKENETVEFIESPRLIRAAAIKCKMNMLTTLKILRPKIHNQTVTLDQMSTPPPPPSPPRIKKEEKIKCGHCDQKFDKNEEKLAHECLHHSPQVQLDVTNVHQISMMLTPACSRPIESRVLKNPKSRVKQITESNTGMKTRQNVNVTNRNMRSMIMSDSIRNESQSNNHIAMEELSPKPSTATNFVSQMSSLANEVQSEFRPRIFNGLGRANLQRNEVEVKSEPVTQTVGVDWLQAFNQIERDMEQQTRNVAIQKSTQYAQVFQEDTSIRQLLEEVSPIKQEFPHQQDSYIINPEPLAQPTCSFQQFHSESQQQPNEMILEAQQNHNDIKIEAQQQMDESIAESQHFQPPQNEPIYQSFQRPSTIEPDSRGNSSEEPESYEIEFEPSNLADEQQSISLNNDLLDELYGIQNSNAIDQMIKPSKLPSQMPLEYQCVECNFVFKYAKHLRLHQRFHYNNGEFMCMKCKKTFDTEDNLNGHKYALHILPIIRLNSKKI